MNTTFPIAQRTTTRGHHTLQITLAAFLAVTALGLLAAKLPGSPGISLANLLAAAVLTALMCAGLNLAVGYYFPPPPSELDKLQVRHLSAYQTWARHELDPHLAFEQPHLLDVRVPETASLIRALRHAEASSSGPVDTYRAAIDELEIALHVALNVADSGPQALNK